MALDDLVGDPGEQLVLAVEAAVRAVAAVGLALALASDDLDDRNADDGGDPVCRVAFLGGQLGETSRTARTRPRERAASASNTDHREELAEVRQCRQ